METESEYEINASLGYLNKIKREKKPNRHAESCKMRQERLADQGLCVKCGKSPHAFLAARCEKCLMSVKSSNNMAAHRRILRKHNMKKSDPVMPA